MQKATILALKEQVAKLKKLLEACSQENERMTKELSKKQENEIKLLKEISDLSKQINKHPIQDVNYYKELSAKRLQESTHLAEQLICLRSDLDKKSFELIKIQKPYNTGAENPEDSTMKEISIGNEKPPEPLTHRPLPYPLNDKIQSHKENIRKTNLHCCKSTSAANIKMQAPNIPYTSAYHPHKL